MRKVRCETRIDGETKRLFFDGIPRREQEIYYPSRSGLFHVITAVVHIPKAGANKKPKLIVYTCPIRYSGGGPVNAIASQRVGFI